MERDEVVEVSLGWEGRFLARQENGSCNWVVKKDSDLQKILKKHSGDIAVSVLFSASEFNTLGGSRDVDTTSREFHSVRTATMVCCVQRWVLQVLGPQGLGAQHTGHYQRSRDQA